jgi:DNA repair exonuclease SbcCD nuclease subunit
VKPDITSVFWGDIHFASYSSGVIVQDVYNVEESITNFCVEHKVDFAVFLGDRFLSHIPSDEDRVLAEKAQRRRNDEGIITFSLMGNHDVKGKGNSSGHSNRLVQQVWPDLHPNLIIMDKPGTYRHTKLAWVAIHAIPAGYQFDWKHFDSINPEERNILVFHDLLQGCQIDVVTAYKAPKGVDIRELDHKEFDCVIGGDVHIPQKLPFANTRGGYAGSSIQQSRRDRGGANGWLYVKLTGDASQSGGFSCELIESKIPRFVDFDWVMDEFHTRLPVPSEIEQLVQDKWGETCEGNIVDLIVTGPRWALDEITKEWLSSTQLALKARRLNPPTKKVLADSSIVIEAEKLLTASPIESFEQFLKSGRAPTTGYDTSRLLAKATDVLSKLGIT